MFQTNPPDGFEYNNKPKNERHELSNEELSDREDYYKQLNESLYGGMDEYSGVQAAKYRSTYDHIDQSATLGVAGSESAPEIINQELRDVKESSSNYARQLGVVNPVDQARFSDIDVRVADATAYAQAANKIGEQGMLHDQDRIRTEKAVAMESSLTSYLEGRSASLFDDIEDSLSRKLRVQIGQLIERYGDVTKASSKELEQLYNELESAKGTKHETASSVSGSVDEDRDASLGQSRQEIEAIYRSLDNTAY